MNKAEATEAIILAKNAKGLSWESIASKIDMSAVWTTSACLGMNSMPEASAAALCELLELDDECKPALMASPYKTWAFDVPQDPLVYRFYEVVGVYGDTLKELIHEKFGDGIMSAIDFTMTVDKEDNPAGDRVVVTMNGKFLKYKSW